MADFDIIRDQTLLFFLDHLMGKGQPRTLHDLSCQFGAKGFTKEMRQIAGGSQAGLRKFLLQFPALFTIEGENVKLTPLTNDQNGSSTRDYTKETIEFFTDKLMSYGIAEVPLKSLFGHRSQASSEIRHVSGQNVKEFREFLQANFDVFVVRDDYVVLQSVLDQLGQEGNNELLRRMPEEISHDPYLMQQLVNDLEDKVYNLTENYSNKISIDLLYNAMKSKEQLPALWNDFVKVPTDLITFLHMNSRIFLVQGNMVSLTNERQAILREKKPNVEQKENNELVDNQSVHSSHNSTGKKTPSIVPNTTAKDSQKLTVNQRIRSQIIKIVSQGCNPTTSETTTRQNSISASTTIDDSTSECLSSDNQYESIDLQTIKPRIIVKNIDCEMIVEDILKNCSAIAFDVEGINLGPNGDVTLIQIAYQNNLKEDTGSNRVNIVLFDVFLNPNLIQNGIKKLLESEKVVKVGHDVRTNSVSLHNSFGITLKNVFDTQVAHLILQQQSTGRPAYKPTKYISFFTLCTVYGGPNLNPKMKDRLHKLYRKDFKYWKNRPLNDEMKQFAVTEVHALYPTVYHKIRNQIRSEYEPLFQQLVYESVFAYINVDEIKQLKRQRKFELELTDLKLKLYNNEKKKIVLSNREIRLLRYVDLTDEIRNKIEGPLNVAKKLKRFESRKQNGSSNAGSNEGDDVKREEGDSSDSYYSDDYVEDERGNIADDIFDEKQSSSLSPSSGQYEHSGEYSSTNNLSEQTTLGPCQCNCHSSTRFVSSKLINTKTSPKSSSLFIEGQSSSGINLEQQYRTSRVRQDSCAERTFCDISTQTLSTGDIVITKIYFIESEPTNSSQM